MRPIDADAFRDWWLCNGENEHIYDTNDVLESIDIWLTLTPPNDMGLGFDVIDTKTGEYPDLEKIALTEEWARGLVYCDMDGFAVREDGSLILLDECGNCVSCPAERFEIRLLNGGDKDEAD